MHGVILLCYGLVVIALTPHLDAVPIDAPKADNSSEGKNVTVIEVTPTPIILEETQAQETETNNSTEDEDINFSDNTQDNVPSASNIEPSVYGQFLPPDPFQQYVNQFGAAAAAYGPYAAYPTPVGYGPPPPAPIYPSPYIVQTGYEGYLVPSTTSASSTGSSTTTTTENSNSNTSLLNPISFITNLIPTIMMSTIFKIFAAILSTIGMVFFGGAITNAICTFTPICDMSFRAINHLKRSGSAEKVGRLVVEELTPERVRRATEFVRNAIRKYKQLQRLVGDEVSADSVAY